MLLQIKISNEINSCPNHIISHTILKKMVVLHAMVVPNGVLQIFFKK